MSEALVKLGQARLAEFEAARAADQEREKDVQEARERLETERVLPLICEALARETGLEAGDFVDVTAVATSSRDWRQDEELPCRATAMLKLPEHNCIGASFYYEHDTGFYRRDGLYWIEGDEEVDQYAPYLDRLDDTLWYAAQLWRRAEAWRVQNEEWKAERDAGERVALAEARSEREMLLEALGDDPVMVGLLKVVVAVQQERGGYQGGIEAMEFDLSQARIDANEQVKCLKQELEAARREAQDYQEQAWEAQDRLDRAAKAQRRGW